MNETVKKTIVPTRLRPGDTIGLVTPSGPVHDQVAVRNGIRSLEEAGFRVKTPVSLHENRYLAGTDEARAHQLTEVWQDREVQAVLAMRGGYGAIRLLPHLDLEAFARTPKILAGFSDITILLNEISRQTGLVTYHAPMLSTLPRCDPRSHRSFISMLSEPAAVINAPDIRIITGGTARGRIIGGNLASLVHLIATPYEPSWDNVILFIEDTAEALYKIDRMLTQLKVSGRLQRISGLIMGTFTGADGREEEWSDLVGQRALELTEGRLPLWANFPVGHGIRNLTLPIGLETIMDSTDSTLKFLDYQDSSASSAATLS